MRTDPPSSRPHEAQADQVARARGNSRTDRPVKTILGGKRVFLMKELPEDAESALHLPRPIIDWEQIARAAGLTEDERQFFLLTNRDGLTRADAGDELRWRARRIDRTRKSISAKLARAELAKSVEPWLCHSSLSLSYREKIAGHRIWSLAKLAPVFMQIMAAERPAVQEFFPAVSKTSKFEDVLMEDPMEDSQSKLRAERAKLDRVVVASQAVDQATDELARRVGQLRAAVQADTEQAVIDERLPDAKLAKNLASAEKDLSATQDRQRQHAGALARQRSIVDGILADIHAGRHQAFINAIAGPQAALNNALEDFLAASSAVHQVIGEYADVAMDYPMFPDAAGAHGNERALARQLVGLAARLDAMRAAAYLPGFEWKAGAAA